MMQRASCAKGRSPCRAHGEEAPCSKCAIENALASPASQLAPSARGRFEPLFGQNFRDVRVHAGAHSKAATDALGARAFTFGRDIVLGDQLSSGSGGESWLLAHELAHVVQQGGADQRGQPLQLGALGNAHEREASAAADAASAGNSARVSTRTASPQLQMEPKVGAKPAAPAATAPAKEAKVEGDFSGCTGEQQSKLTKYLQTARTWVKAARAAISRLKGSGASAKETETFTHHFHFDPKQPGKGDLTGEVETAYSRIEQGFSQKVPFKCENDASEDNPTHASTSGIAFLHCYGPIHVYPRFWQSEFPGMDDAATAAGDDDLRTQILIHEMAHRNAYRTGESYQADYRGDYSTLKPKDAVENADTYAVFARRIGKK